jgi:hypothetical protein
MPGVEPHHLNCDIEMILKGLAGISIGIGYGVLVGAVIVLLGRLEPDVPYPGALIPDVNGMRRLLSFLAIAITGACGILVGLLVGISSVGKAKAAPIGFGIGLLALACLGGLENASLREWLIMPIGLSLLALMVSAVTNKPASYRRDAPPDNDTRHA